VSTAEGPTTAPESPAPKWGDPISAQLQAELQGILDAWNAPGADHGYRKGPFYTVPLTGADVYWLAERERQPSMVACLRDPLLDLHLETFYVNTRGCFPRKCPALAVQAAGAGVSVTV
jgi:hypothetical protein